MPHVDIQAPPRPGAAQVSRHGRSNAGADDDKPRWNRPQPIRPALAGFGEPVTDWLLQSAMEARPGESAFALEAGPGWPHGGGWLFVFALRWLGAARRLAAPDGIAVVFCPEAQPAKVLTSVDCSLLIREADHFERAASLSPPPLAGALEKARDLLRERVGKRDTTTRQSAGLALLLVANVAVAHSIAGEP